MTLATPVEDRANAALSIRPVCGEIIRGRDGCGIDIHSVVFAVRACDGYRVPGLKKCVVWGYPCSKELQERGEIRFVVLG